VLAPKNKQELFALLDSHYNTDLDTNSQNTVWMGSIDQSLGTNPGLVAIVGDDRSVLWQEYIESRAKRGCKADYD